MYTRCPHCQTLFRISAEQLKAAAGKAHCCCCDQIFSALENLCEPATDETWPDSRPTSEPPAQQNLELSFDSPQASDSNRLSLDDLLRTLKIDPVQSPSSGQASPGELASDDQRDPFEPAYDLSGIGMDSVRIGLDSELVGPYDTPPVAPADANDPASETRQDQPEDERPNQGHRSESASDPLPPPFDIPEDLPPIEPTSREPLTLESTLAQDTKGRGTVGWSLAILLLLLMALAQLAWFGRDHLLRYPGGRTLLETACEYLPCTLPPQRDADRIAVVSRSISTHPTRHDGLLVRLTLRNQAAFEQPLPTLQISLLDNQGQLVARRSFTPAQYGNGDRTLLQPGVPVAFQLELEDPGETVAGFTFDFY